MNTPNKIYGIAALIAAFAFINTAAAQGYQATGDDGITASPKWRQFLNEQKVKADAARSSQTTSTLIVGYQSTGEDGVTAPPKWRKFLNEQETKVKTTPPSQADTAEDIPYEATGNDGITASPKYRETLNEQSSNGEDETAK